MVGWVDRFLADSTRESVQLTARFTEARHRVLAENIANIDTPDYHSKRLDLDTFQTSLTEALDDAADRRPAPLHLRGNAQFQAAGPDHVRVRPETEPAPNVLFHDGTNARLEDLMSATAANELLHNLALNLLGGSFNTTLSAIRGRSG